jgi:hypothetical protein
MHKLITTLAIATISCLTVASCSPRKVDVQRSEQIPTIENGKVSLQSCIDPEAFEKLTVGMALTTVTTVLGKGWRTADSNSVNGIEFKTLQWKNCGVLYSVTFKNGVIDSKFMIDGVR